MEIGQRPPKKRKKKSREWSQKLAESGNATDGTCPGTAVIGWIRRRGPPNLKPGDLDPFLFFLQEGFGRPGGWVGPSLAFPISAANSLGADQSRRTDKTGPDEKSDMVCQGTDLSGPPCPIPPAYVFFAGSMDGCETGARGGGLRKGLDGFA